MRGRKRSSCSSAHHLHDANGANARVTTSRRYVDCPRTDDETDGRPRVGYARWRLRIVVVSCDGSCCFGASTAATLRTRCYLQGLPSWNRRDRPTHTAHLRPMTAPRQSHGWGSGWLSRMRMLASQEGGLEWPICRMPLLTQEVAPRRHCCGATMEVFRVWPYLRTIGDFCENDENDVTAESYENDGSDGSADWNVH